MGNKETDSCEEFDGANCTPVTQTRSSDNVKADLLSTGLPHLRTGYWEWQDKLQNYSTNFVPPLAEPGDLRGIPHSPEVLEAATIIGLKISVLCLLDPGSISRVKTIINLAVHGEISREGRGRCRGVSSPLRLTGRRSGLVGKLAAQNVRNYSRESLGATHALVLHKSPWGCAQNSEEDFRIALYAKRNSMPFSTAQTRGELRHRG